MFDGVSQLLTISPVKALKNSVENTEVRQTDNGGALVVDNGSPADGQDSSVANTGQDDPGTVQAKRQSSI